MHHEYKVLHVTTPDAHSVEKVVNELCSEGWLLDKITQDVEGRPVYLIFMRVR